MTAHARSRASRPASFAPRDLLCAPRAFGGPTDPRVCRASTVSCRLTPQLFQNRCRYMLCLSSHSRDNGGAAHGLPQCIEGELWLETGRHSVAEQCKHGVGRRDRARLPLRAPLVLAENDKAHGKCSTANPSPQLLDRPLPSWLLGMLSDRKRLGIRMHTTSHIQDGEFVGVIARTRSYQGRHQSRLTTE